MPEGISPPFTFFTRRTLVEKHAIFQEILSRQEKTVFVPPAELGVISLHHFLTSKLMGPVFEQIGRCVSTDGSPTRASVRSPQWMVRRLKAGFYWDFKQIIVDDGAFWHPDTASELFPLLQKLQKRSGTHCRSDPATTVEGAVAIRIVVITDERSEWPFPWWQEHWMHRVFQSTQDPNAVPHNELEDHAWKHHDDDAGKQKEDDAWKHHDGDAGRKHQEDDAWKHHDGDPWGDQDGDIWEQEYGDAWGDQEYDTRGHEDEHTWGYESNEKTRNNSTNDKSADLPRNVELASEVPSNASIYSTCSPRSTPDDAFDTQSECDKGYRQIFLDSPTPHVVPHVTRELGVTQANLAPSDAVNLCCSALYKLLADPCTHSQYVRPGFVALVFVPAAMDALHCKQKFECETPRTPFSPPSCSVRFLVLNDVLTLSYQVGQIRNADVANNARVSCEQPYTVVFSSTIGEQLRLPFINLILDCGVDEHDPLSWYTLYRQRARTVVLEDSIDIHMMDAQRTGDINDGTTIPGTASPRVSALDDSDGNSDDDDDFSDDTLASSDDGVRRRRRRRTGWHVAEQHVEEFWQQMVKENEEEVEYIAKKKNQNHRLKCLFDKWSRPKALTCTSPWQDHQQNSEVRRARTSRLILHLYYSDTPLAPVMLPIEEPETERFVQDKENDGEKDGDDCEENNVDPVDVLSKATGLYPQAAKIVWAGILFGCLPSCVVIAAALDVKRTVDMWRHALPKNNFSAADYEFLHKLTAIMKAVDLHHRGDLEFYRNIFIDYLVRIRSHHRSWISPTNLGPIIDVMNPVFIDTWFSVISGLVRFLRSCFHFTETLEFFNEQHWEAFNTVSSTEYRVSRVDEGLKKVGDILRDWYGDQDHLVHTNHLDGVTATDDASAQKDGPREPTVRVGMNLDNIPKTFPAVVTFTQKTEMGDKLNDFLEILHRSTKTPGSTMYPIVLRLFPREEPILLPALTYALEHVAVALNPHGLPTYSLKLSEYRKACGLASCKCQVFCVDGCEREDLEKLLPLLRDVAPSAGKVDGGPKKGGEKTSEEDTVHVPLSLLEDFHVSDDSGVSHAKLAFYEEEHIDVSPAVVGSEHRICPEGHVMRKLTFFPFQGQTFRCHCNTKISEPPFYYCTFCLTLNGYCLACGDSPAITGIIAPSYQSDQTIVHPNLAMLKLGAKPFSLAGNSMTRVHITHPWHVHWYVPHQHDVISARWATVSNVSSAWWLCSEDAPRTQLCLFSGLSSDDSDDTPMLHDVVILPVTEDRRAILWTLAFHAHPDGATCVFDNVDQTTSSTEKKARPNIIGFTAHGIQVRFAHCPIPYAALDGPRIVRRELQSLKSGAALGWYKGTLDLASFITVHKATLSKLRQGALPSFKLSRGTPRCTHKDPTMDQVAQLLPVGDDGESPFEDPVEKSVATLATWGYGACNDDEAHLSHDDPVQAKGAERGTPSVDDGNHTARRVVIPSTDDCEKRMYPCRAVASYAGIVGATDHVTFHAGDLILCEETAANGWALGVVHGPPWTLPAATTAQWYPAAYCERMTQTVTAVSAFRPRDDAYDFPTLELEKGDEVVLCGGDDQGWTLGFHKNMVGYFPTQFCTA